MHKIISIDINISSIDLGRYVIMFVEWTHLPQPASYESSSRECRREVYPIARDNCASSSVESMSQM